MMTGGGVRPEHVGLGEVVEREHAVGADEERGQPQLGAVPLQQAHHAVERAVVGHAVQVHLTQLVSTQHSCLDTPLKIVHRYFS